MSATRGKTHYSMVIRWSDRDSAYLVTLPEWMPYLINRVAVTHGATYEEALADVKSAIAFHVETFGPGVIESEAPVLEAFVAELGVAA